MFALVLGGCDRQSGDAPQDGGDKGVVGGVGASGDGGRYDGSETMGVVSIDYRGMAAPDLAFQNPEGEAIRLSDFEGQPLLVNLWATWCAPCIAEMPTLDRLAEEYDGQIKVLTISQDLQGAEVVTPFLAERRFRHLEDWLDEDNAMMAGIESQTLPTTILYDAYGNELFRVIGGMDWAGERAERLIEGALGS
ncbi:MAG: TlpA family protein disulfide reductase [Sphingomonadaceae bacterium]|nr:TlpA family protein disulfide reductase [Sphingomonadaceae bacterium]